MRWSLPWSRTARLSKVTEVPRASTWRPSRLPPYGLDDVRGPLERVVDEHMFAIPDDGVRGTCRLQILTGPGAPLVIATQLSEGEGLSLPNGAEEFLLAAWERYLPQEDRAPAYVDMHLGVPFRQGVWGSEIAWFDDRLLGSTTGPIPEQLRELIGAAADFDRGTGYVPYVEPPPTYADVWVADEVRVLPEPEPSRAPCLLLNDPNREWAVDGSCCWYHSVDWAVAVDLAEAAVRADPSDLPALETRGDVRARDADGAETLLLIPVVIGTAAGEDDWYINGQHRTQAMRDQGVTRTLTQRRRGVDDPPLRGEIRPTAEPARIEDDDHPHPTG